MQHKRLSPDSLIHIIQKHYEYLFSEQDLKSFATIYMVIL